MHYITAIDTLLFLKINEFVGSVFWDTFFVFAAEKLSFIAVGAFLVLFILLRKNGKVKNDFFYITLFSAFIARFGIVEIMRLFYNRERPFEVFSISQLIEHSSGNSFPSGHAAFFFALAVGIYFYNKKAGAWFIGAAGLISFARIYGGIHYPLDIIVGAVIGTVVAIIIHSIVYRSTRIDLSP